MKFLKHFLKFIIVSVTIIVIAFILVNITGRYKVDILGSNIKWSIDSKNCKKAVDFDKDDERNTYIAYSDSISVMREDGKENILLNDSSLNVDRMLFYDGRIYYLSDDKLYVYDIYKGKSKVILDEIPYKGDNVDRRMIIKDSKLLLSIGSATNSGIADNNEEYKINEIPYDLTPINITLTGNNYGKKKTGPFMPYGNSSLKGQKIKCRNIANSSVVEIDLNSNKTSLYACGIRNITGWDINSNNELICIVGGMENKGDRPVKRDFDYIYKIQKNNWYGWPDYSGGDPIESPRFNEEKPITRIIENHPNKNVPGPLYQFDHVSSMRCLAIDKNNGVLGKDTMVYYDTDRNVISSLDNNLIMNRLLKLKEDSIIKEIKIKDNSIYILDSGVGCIYRLNSIDGNFMFNIPRVILIFILMLLGSLVFVLIYKYNNGKVNK